MSTLSRGLNRDGATHSVLAIAAAIIFIAVITGLNERLGLGDSAAFWALFLAGVALCARGPLGHGTTYGWGNPLHIAGYVLGMLLLLLGAAVLFNLAIPGISSVQGATVLLSVLMIVKGVLAMFYRRPA